MKKFLTPAIALLASAFLVSVTLAQSAPTRPPMAGAPPASRQGMPRRAPDDSMRGPRGMAGMPRMAGVNGMDVPRGGGAASHLLRARRQLELTDEQVKKLEALASAATPINNRSELLRAQADMMDATKGDGDLAAARAALDKMSRVRNDGAIARLKSRQDMRAILTPTQKAKFDNMRGMMRDRMGKRGMHNGGGRGGAGMNHRQMRSGQQMGRPGQPMGPRNRQAPPMRPPDGQ